MPADGSVEARRSVGPRAGPASRGSDRRPGDNRSDDGRRSSMARDPGQICLRPGELHLWTVAYDVESFPDLDDAELLLSADERERSHRFRCAEARRQFVSGRILVRSALSQHCPVKPQAWTFAQDANGKPFVLAPDRYRDLRFSLSHTEGLTACLTSRIEAAAVDVEKIKDLADLPLLVSQVLSPVELRTIATLSGDAWLTRFFDYWTLKEAYAKARGLGLSLGLTNVAFEFGVGEDFSVSFDGGLDGDLDAWTFRHYRLSPNYSAAIAVNCGGQPGLVVVHHPLQFNPSSATLNVVVPSVSRRIQGNDPGPVSIPKGLWP